MPGNPAHAPKTAKPPPKTAAPKTVAPPPRPPTAEAALTTPQSFASPPPLLQAAPAYGTDVKAPSQDNSYLVYLAAAGAALVLWLRKG